MNTQKAAFITYANIRKDYEILSYLYYGENGLMKKLCDKDELFFHYRFLLLKDLSIEIDKAISYRSKKKKKEKVFSGLTMDVLKDVSLKPKQLKRIKTKLWSLKEAIEHNVYVRDKYFAHLDKDYENYVKDIKIRMLRKLVFFIQDILCKAYGTKKIDSLLSAIPSSADYPKIKLFTFEPKYT